MRLGSKMTLAQRKRISKAHKGIRLSEAAKEKVRAFQKTFKHTKAHNKRISQALKGRKYSKALCRKLSLAHKGKTLSEEEKQKRRGWHHTKAWKRRMSKILKARNFHHTKAARKRMSKAQKGKTVSAELRAHLSEVLSGRKMPNWVIAKQRKAFQMWSPTKRKRLARKQRKMWEEPGRKEQASLRAKKLWKNERETMMQNRRIGIKHSDAVKLKIGESNKRTWSLKRSSARRAAVSERSKQLWKNPEYRQFMKGVTAKVNANISKETREKVSKALLGHKVSKAVRARLAEAGRQQWEARSPQEKIDFMVRFRKANAVRETRIEKAVQAALKKLNVPFDPHKRIGPYTADIFLAAHKTVIECDGTYWHGTPKAIAHDEKRDKYMLKRKLKVIRLKEKDIMKNALRCTKRALLNFIPDALAMNAESGKRS